MCKTVDIFDLGNYCKYFPFYSSPLASVPTLGIVHIAPDAKCCCYLQFWF